MVNQRVKNEITITFNYKDKDRAASVIEYYLKNTKYKLFSKYIPENKNDGDGYYDLRYISEITGVKKPHLKCECGSEKTGII